MNNTGQAQVVSNALRERNSFFPSASPDATAMSREVLCGLFEAGRVKVGAQVAETENRSTAK